MAKPQHAKRTRPRPAPLKRRHLVQLRAAEQRALRDLERWRRAS